MAYISKQCITCTEPTKRERGKYHGNDEKGKYSGSLYECDNVCCKIYYSRRRQTVTKKSELKNDNKAEMTWHDN